MVISKIISSDLSGNAFFIIETFS